MWSTEGAIYWQGMQMKESSIVRINKLESRKGQSALRVGANHMLQVPDL